MFYAPPQGPHPWPSGPCGQVCTGCTLCGRGLGNGGGLVLCVECGEAIRDAYSPMGILLRESFAAAKRRRAAEAAATGDANAGH